MADDATHTETSTATETAPSDAVVDATALGGAVADGEGAEAVVEAKPEGEAAEGEKALGAKPEGAEVPDTYDLKLEGAELDAKAVEAATPVFKELGLTNDQANKLMPVADAFAKSITERNNQAILEGVATQRKEWLDTAKADKEIGGQQFDANLVVAAKALDQLGFAKGSPFRALLDESGLGNHPEMIRAFVKVGKAIGEDSDFARGTGSAAKQDRLSTLYPDDVKA